MAELIGLQEIHVFRLPRTNLSKFDCESARTEFIVKF